MNEVITKDAQAVAVDAPQDNMAMMIVQMASNADLDVGKLEKLLDLQERETKRQAQVAFSQAFAQMQADIPTVAKTKAGNGSKYATLEDVIEITRPVLNEHGFAVSFDTKTEMREPRKIGDNVVYDGSVTVTAVLMHKMGHQTSTSLVVPFDFSGSKKSNTAQAMGSAVSYGKRYALCSLLNIATRDDNDAASATANQGQLVAVSQVKQLDKLFGKLSDERQAAFIEWLKGAYSVDSIANLPAYAYNNINIQLSKAARHADN